MFSCSFGCELNEGNRQQGRQLRQTDEWMHLLHYDMRLFHVFVNVAHWEKKEK